MIIDPSQLKMFKIQLHSYLSDALNIFLRRVSLFPTTCLAWSLGVTSTAAGRTSLRCGPWWWLTKLTETLLFTACRPGTYPRDSSRSSSHWRGQPRTRVALCRWELPICHRRSSGATGLNTQPSATIPTLPSTTSPSLPSTTVNQTELRG